MNGIGIAWGMIGTATIAACIYMIERGYAWWQVALMALLGLTLMPYYRRREDR